MKEAWEKHAFLINTEGLPDHYPEDPSIFKLKIHGF